MCPCKKEILEPPDTLWFFLLLGFALAVALLFLLCQLLKHHLKGSSSNGLVYVIPEAEISKRITPEFSDRLVGKAQGASALPAQFVAISESNSAGIIGATTKSSPELITIAPQNTAPESKQRSIQLRSLALKNSAATLSPLDANTLPIIFAESNPEAQTKEASLNSTENDSDEPTEEEDEEEILAAGMSGPSLSIQARSLPKLVPKKQDESTQTCTDAEPTLKNDEMAHPKIKLRSLHVGAKQKAGAPKRATDTVKARNDSHARNTVNATNGQTTNTIIVPNQVQASNTITFNQAQVTNTNGDSAKNGQIKNSTLIAQTETEAFQKSHSERMSSTTTTEMMQGQYFNLNNASLSRLRRREYELATLLRQLRNVEDKVGQLSTELEKKDLLISHYKHGDLQHVSPGYVNSPISLSRDDTPHSLHNPQIPNSPLMLTTAGMSIQRSLHGAHQYEKLEQLSTPVPERNVTTAETTRISDNASLTPDGKYGYSGSGSLLLSPAVTRRANGTLATEITTVGHSDSQNYKESANSITNGYHDVDISATRFTPSRNSIEDFEINSELKLAEALKQLRIENELRVAQTRDEQEAAYAKRESELYRQILTLANSFQQQNNEFNSLQFKLLTLEQNLAELHGKKLSAESSLRETRSSWQEGQGQGQFSSEIKRLKDLIKVMETEKQELLGRYQHLQEAKTTLDSEIFTYQSLLEEEEQRIEQVSGFKGSRSGNSSFRIATRNGGNISGISKNVTWKELPQLTRMTSATSSKGYSIESEI